MNKLFGLFLLALACWVPTSAWAASRFLTCTTTCTITAIDTTIWGSTSGGTGASVPVAADDVTLDAATCVGGTTCTMTFGPGYNPTWLQITMSACTASTSGCILEANTNSNTITLTNASTPYTNTGAGNRTLSGGTWVLSGNTATWNIAASATVTNNPSVSFTGTGGTGARRFTGGGKTYGTVSVSSGTSPFVIANANTITTFTVAPLNRVIFPDATTTTITTFTNISGSASTPTLLGTGGVNGQPTIALGNNATCTFCGISGLILSGSTFSATSSFDFGGNSGTVSIGSSFGAGGGRIIGG